MWELRGIAGWAIAVGLVAWIVLAGLWVIDAWPWRRKRTLPPRPLPRSVVRRAAEPIEAGELVVLRQDGRVESLRTAEQRAQFERKMRIADEEDGGEHG